MVCIAVESHGHHHCGFEISIQLICKVKWIGGEGGGQKCGEKF